LLTHKALSYRFRPCRRPYMF